MQRVDAGGGGRDGGAFDVDVALWRRLVHIDVQHAAVFIAFLDDVVAHFRVPVHAQLARGKEI